MTSMDKKNKIAILLVGEAATGKTSLINRYITNSFNPNTASTIGIDYRTKKDTYNGQDVKLEIWDTAGQEKYQALPATFYSRADAIAVVFSLVCMESFKKVDSWIESILNYKSENEVTIAILGNKADLKNERVVPEADIQKMCNEKNIQYFPVSALSGLGVDNVFNYFTEKVLERKNVNTEAKGVVLEKKKKPNKCC